MKKLMVAAVAATMASVSMADISITGDAFLSYASNKIGAGDSAVKTNNAKRVNLNIVGKSGATKVVASIRHDDNVGATTTNSRATSSNSSSFDMHQFYITTKVGTVNIKAGDYYGTIGLGARSKGAPKKDALSLSTKVGPVKLGVFTRMSNGVGVSDATNISASGKVAGATVKVVHNPHKTSGFTDLSVKGTFNGILVAAEKWDAKAVNSDTTLLHVGGKAGGIQLDAAYLKNGSAITTGNAKFAPLGSMLIGKSARGRTITAAADIGNFKKLIGISASTKIAGNTIKAIFAKGTSNNATLSDVNDKVTGSELILTRAMSGGKLTANLAKLSGSTVTNNNKTNSGIRFDVKF